MQNTKLPMTSYDPINGFKFQPDTLLVGTAKSGYSAGIVNRSSLLKLEEMGYVPLDTISNTNNIITGNEISGFLMAVLTVINLVNADVLGVDVVPVVFSASIPDHPTEFVFLIFVFKFKTFGKINEAANGTDLAIGNGRSKNFKNEIVRIDSVVVDHDQNIVAIIKGGFETEIVTGGKANIAMTSNIYCARIFF